MERQDIIFCKMLTYESNVIGSFEAPVIINEYNLKQSLRHGQPAIMQHIKEWIITAKDNRMVVFTTKHGDSWALMNTTRVSLNGERTINWVYIKSEPSAWLQRFNNPVWITTYRQINRLI
jgi:hypothetical protein